MESVNPEFAPSHRKIECTRTDNIFWSYLTEVSTGTVGAILVGSVQSAIPGQKITIFFVLIH